MKKIVITTKLDNTFSVEDDFDLSDAKSVEQLIEYGTPVSSEEAKEIVQTYDVESGEGADWSLGDIVRYT